MIENIALEKKRAQNQCLILENQKEQINLLIAQLQSLVLIRPNFLTSILDSKENQIDYIKPSTVAVNKELNKAMIDRNNLETNIKSLKHKIQRLNQTIQ